MRDGEVVDADEYISSPQSNLCSMRSTEHLVQSSNHFLFVVTMDKPHSQWTPVDLDGVGVHPRMKGEEDWSAGVS